MIIARLHAKGKPLSRRLSRCGQKLGLQLISQEGIGVALIHQNVVEHARRRTVLDQQGGVVVRPFGAVFAQIGRERLLAPGAASRRRDGGKG
ncbi:hypothetical protein D3C87_1973000 [compost metagenome]